MELSKKFLEQEIENARITIEKLEQGIIVNSWVKEMFEAKLKDAK